jgi:muramoyltetrapeptide carboxypeptidase
MLTQLWLAGKFKGVRGLILGVFAGCEARDENSFRLRETITRKLQPLDIPTVYGFSFGHISNQATFPIGAQAVFDTERFSLNILRR